MKKLFFLLLFVSFKVMAQEPAYTPMRLNYQFRGIKVDSLFLVPSYTDTTQANGYSAKNIPGSLIRTGSDFWMRNGTATAWLQNVNVGPGSSPVVQFVDSVWRVSGKDSIFWRKGGVTNRIKDSIGLVKAVDTIYRTAGKDSIFFKIGNNTYRIKDSIGASPNINLNQVLSNGNFGLKKDIRIGTDTIGSKNLITFFGSDTGQGYPLITMGDRWNYNLTINPRFINVGGGSLPSDGGGSITINASDSANILFSGTRTNTQHNWHTLLRVNSNRSVLDVNTNGGWKHYLPLDSGVIVQKVQNIKADTTGHVELMNVVDSVSIINADYYITKPGFYTIFDNDDSYKVDFPDPADFKGNMIMILNLDTESFNTQGFQPINKAGTTIGTIQAGDFIQFISDGFNWWGGYFN